MKNGWHEYNMYPYVKRNLRKKYPKNLGWEIIQQDRWNGTDLHSGYETDFTVERKKRSGFTERIIVEVKAECNAKQEHIDQLNSYVQKISGGYVRIIDKILVYPSGADVSIVPEDINIMKLRNFKCENSDITWYTN